MLQLVLSPQKILMQRLLGATRTRAITDCNAEVFVELISEKGDWLGFRHRRNSFYKILSVLTLLIRVLEKERFRFVIEKVRALV